MTPKDTNLGFIDTLGSLRIPIVTEAQQNKQCFYLSHDKLTVTLVIPASDNSQVCFQFGKCASGEDIEESLVRDILRTTKAGHRLHQARLEDMHKQLQSALDREGDAWIRGFSAGTARDWLNRAKEAIITTLVSFSIGLAIGYFA